MALPDDADIFTTSRVNPPAELIASPPDLPEAVSASLACYRLVGCGKVGAEEGLNRAILTVTERIREMGLRPVVDTRVANPDRIEDLVEQYISLWRVYAELRSGAEGGTGR